MQWVATTCAISMTNRIHDRAVHLLDVSRRSRSGAAGAVSGLMEADEHSMPGPATTMEEEQMELLEAIAASMNECSAPGAYSASPKIRHMAISALLEQVCAPPQTERPTVRQEDGFSSWMRNNRLVPSLRT